MAEANSMTSTIASSQSDEAGLAPGETPSGVAGDEDATASSSMSRSSQSSQFVTAKMSEVEILDAIEKSREHGWTEPRDRVGGGGMASDHRDLNARSWAKLKKENPELFKDPETLGLKLGRLIAEGGQAQIFECTAAGVDRPLVAKVFKLEGLSLADFRRHLPLAKKRRWWTSIFRKSVSSGITFGVFSHCCCPLLMGSFLKDGRFLFLMGRYWGDLRTYIDLEMKKRNSKGPLFEVSQAHFMMLNIAMGMRDLHARDILHRDLKASNVLLDSYRDPVCQVGDYETSMLVQGTGFWRAPEVLEDLMKDAGDRNKHIWTKKVDVYSFAMTCYEVLTGLTPFAGYFKRDWQRVIDGERPSWPDYAHPQFRALEMCWDKVPSKRPTFEFIVSVLDKWGIAGMALSSSVCD